MKELFVKELNTDAEHVHSRLMDCIIEDTKQNAKQFHSLGVFMGKVGAKKFYMFYKPPYMRLRSFLTVLRGDVCVAEDGKTRIRYRFCKFKGPRILATLLLIAVTILEVYAWMCEGRNVAVTICISGFWLLCIGLYVFSMISSKAAQDRFLEFLDNLEK